MHSTILCESNQINYIFLWKAVTITKAAHCSKDLDWTSTLTSRKALTSWLRFYIYAMRS